MTKYLKLVLIKTRAEIRLDFLNCVFLIASLCIVHVVVMQISPM